MQTRSAAKISPKRHGAAAQPAGPQQPPQQQQHAAEAQEARLLGCARAWSINAGAATLLAVGVGKRERVRFAR
jgi:hypothetical protein